MEERTKLRNQLFEKYFENQEGIELTTFVNRMSFITDTWKHLHKLLEENVRHYDSYSRLEMLKRIEHRGINYVIIKLDLWKYIIIDIDHNKVLEKEEIQSTFEERFFLIHFAEEKSSSEDYLDMYSFPKYQGNIQEFIAFYLKNQEILMLPTRIYYKLTIDEAWTYFSLNFASGKAQLGFQTPDQYLYEQLFFYSDLTPFGMQDAISRIGIEKMREMFERIKSIKIPKECIPTDIYEKFFASFEITQPENTSGPMLIKKNENR